MPGEFHVKGSFMVTARNRLVIYGDIVQGTVSGGDELLVPLNSSTAMTVPIESVETVDGTPTSSHVALVVAEDDSLMHDLLGALGFTGETLLVQVAPVALGG